MVTRSPVGELLQPWKSIDGMAGSSKARALCQEIWPEVTAFGDAYQMWPRLGSVDDIRLSYLSQQLKDWFPSQMDSWGIWDNYWSIGISDIKKPQQTKKFPPEQRISKDL